MREGERVILLLVTRREGGVAVALEFNPLSPKGDQYQISPCNITAL